MSGQRTLGNAYAQYTLIPNLSFKLNVGFDYQNRRKDTFVNSKSLQGERYGGAATINTLTNSNYLIEGTSTYNKEFNNSTLTVLAGVTYQIFSDVGFVGSASGFSIENMQTNSIQSADVDTYDMESWKYSNTLLS